MKSMKSLVAAGAVAFGLISSTVVAQPGAGAPGAGAGQGRGGQGRGGAGAIAMAPAAPPTLEAVTTAVTGLTDDQKAKIKTELDAAKVAYDAYTKASADYTAARTKNIDAINALLTADQKTAFAPIANPAAGGRGRGGQGAGAGFGAGGPGAGGPGAGGPGAGAGAGGRGGRGGRGAGAPGAPAGAPGA